MKNVIKDYYMEPENISIKEEHSEDQNEVDLDNMPGFL